MRAWAVADALHRMAFRRDIAAGMSTTASGSSASTTRKACRARFCHAFFASSAGREPFEAAQVESSASILPILRHAEGFPLRLPVEKQAQTKTSAPARWGLALYGVSTSISPAS